MKMRAHKRLNDHWQTGRQSRRFRARWMRETRDYPSCVVDDAMDAFKAIFDDWMSTLARQYFTVKPVIRIDGI